MKDLKYLNGYMTVKKLAESLGVSPRTVSRRVAEMQHLKIFKNEIITDGIYTFVNYDSYIKFLKLRRAKDD